MLNLKALVVGTGRCGTVYMARLLTSIGLPCGHESVFNHIGLQRAIDVINGTEMPQLSKISQCDLLKDQRIPTWVDETNIVADSSYQAVPFLNHHLFCNIPLIHVVRHPLDVVSSFVLDFGYFQPSLEKDDPWHKFIHRHLPGLKPIHNPIEAACFYYVRWNSMIENASMRFPRRYLFQKIEEMPSDSFFDFLDMDRPLDMFGDTRINSCRRRKNNIRLREIPNSIIKENFVAMMRRYNYENSNCD